MMIRKADGRMERRGNGGGSLRCRNRGNLKLKRPAFVINVSLGLLSSSGVITTLIAQRRSPVATRGSSNYRDLPEILSQLVCQAKLPSYGGEKKRNTQKLSNSIIPHRLPRDNVWRKQKSAFPPWKKISYPTLVCQKIFVPSRTCVLFIKLITQWVRALTQTRRK